MKTLIKRLTLSDFGPLKGTHELEFDGPGTYAICAPNGKGKSHVLEALRSVSVASLRNTNKPMGSYVHGLGCVDDITKAIVDAEFDVQGEPMQIKRTFRLALPDTEEELGTLLKSGESPKCSSVYSASFRGQKHRSEADVSELLGSVIGLNNKIQENAVFVFQERSGEVLKATPSVRSKALQCLSGAEICEKACEAAKRKLNLIHVTDLTEQIAEAEQNLTSARARLLDAQKDVEALSKSVMDPETLEAKKAALEAHRAADEAADKLASLLDRKKRLDTDIRDLTTAVNARHMEADSLHDEWDERKDEYTAAKKTLASAESAAKLEAQRRELEKELEILAQEEADACEPQPPTVQESALEQLKQDYQTFSTSLATSKDFLKVFGESGVCPVCKSRPHEPHVCEEHKKTVEQLESLVVDLDEQIKATTKMWEDYRRNQATYKQWHDSWLRRTAQTEERLKAIGAVETADAGQLAELNRLVIAYEEAVNKIAELERSSSRDEATVNAAKESADSISQEISDLEAKVGGRLSDEEAQSITDSLHAQETAREDLARMRGFAESAEENVVAAESKLKLLQESQEATSKKLEAKQFLDSVRAAMHHTAIPHDRSVLYLSRVNTLMEKWCDILHAPFTLFLDPDTQNVMSQRGSFVEPYYQLSGGQRTLAAWAWHMSLYELHGSQVGFIFMDEPTVGLDEANISHVAEAVERLSEHCAGSGLQFIMVTHEEELAAAFSRKLGL